VESFNRKELKELKERWQLVPALGSLRALRLNSLRLFPDPTYLGPDEFPNLEFVQNGYGHAIERSLAPHP